MGKSFSDALSWAIIGRGQLWLIWRGKREGGLHSKMSLFEGDKPLGSMAFTPKKKWGGSNAAF